jgi:hypothetical protein
MMTIIDYGTAGLRDYETAALRCFDCALQPQAQGPTGIIPR